MREATEQCTEGLPTECNTMGSSFKKIGNISSCLVEVIGEVIGTENEFNKAPADSRVLIERVNISLSILCSSTKNLIWALLSETQEDETAMGHVQDFCITEDLSECDFYPFDFKGVDAGSVAVYLKTDDVVDSTLVEGTDYEVSGSGVSILHDIAIGSSNTLRIAFTYTNASFPSIKFNTKLAKYREIYFKGVNYGEGNESLFDARFYRVLLAPVNQLDLITRDEFMTLNLTGVVEPQEGQWFTIDKQEA